MPFYKEISLYDCILLTVKVRLTSRSDEIQGGGYLILAILIPNI